MNKRLVKLALATLIGFTCSSLAMAQSNTSTVSSTGNYLEAVVTQSGSGNEATVTQGNSSPPASNHSAYIQQVGSSNTAGQTQNGANYQTKEYLDEAPLHTDLPTGLNILNSLLMLIRMGMVFRQHYKS